jgi:uncharacterized membrane protein YeaQ/YmgE (transglycosylase-associated protein family)
MTVVEFILLLVVAGICGAVAQALVGYSRGGCLVAMALGFIGALLGTWMARALDLPEYLHDLRRRPPFSHHLVHHWGIVICRPAQPDNAKKNGGLNCLEWAAGRDTWAVPGVKGRNERRIIMGLVFESFFADGISQLSYLIGDDAQGIAAVIDPRPDVEAYLETARQREVSITHVFETHIHADFMSGSRDGA